MRLPYSLKVAHSSVVSAVLAADELVPHTLLLSELITCHASHVTNVTKVSGVLTSPSSKWTRSLKGTSLVHRVVPLFTAL